MLAPLLPAVLALSVPSVLQTQEPSTGTRALAVEALGGTAGSLAGVAAGLALHRAIAGTCHGDDLACVFEKIGTVGLVSVVGATVGTVAVGRAAGTRPSVLGATLGAVVGMAAGVGVMQLFEDLAQVRDRSARIGMYVVTQGVVTAIGSAVARRR
jgi:hypothetical protein